MYKILFYNFNPYSVNNAHIGFVQMGCHVLNYTCKNYNTDPNITVKELQFLINRFRPDIIFSYGWWRGRININAFCNTIKRWGVYHVFWAFDDPECYELISLPIAKQCDLVFTTVLECIEKYEANKVKAKLLLHGCNPLDHRKVPSNPKFQHDLVLLGNNYNVKWKRNYFAYRYEGIKNLIIPLVKNKQDLMVWGHFWRTPDRIYTLPAKHYGSVIPYGHEAEIYSSAKIALGLQSVGDSLTHFSVRTFEAMGCGTFHLSQYSPALEHFFKKGVHLEWSKSPKETISLVNFYLKNDDLRKKIALAGQNEVYSKHTLKQRAESVLSMLKKEGI